MTLYTIQVHLYGNPKNRPKEVPLYAEVCEACKVHLDNKEEIPDLLLAKLIKYKLLSIKADDVKRRQLTNKVKTKYYFFCYIIKSLRIIRTALSIITISL